jgi:hypothetical protein
MSSRDMSLARSIERRASNMQLLVIAKQLLGKM